MDSWKLPILVIVVLSLEAYAQDFQVIEATSSECSVPDSIELVRAFNFVKKKIKMAGDTMTCEIVAPLNCADNGIVGGFKRSDSIFLQFGANYTVGEDGSRSIEHMLCDCVFRFRYVLLGVREEDVLIWRNETFDVDMPIAKFEEWEHAN